MRLSCEYLPETNSLWSSSNDQTSTCYSRDPLICIGIGNRRVYERFYLFEYTWRRKAFRENDYLRCFKEKKRLIINPYPILLRGAATFLSGTATATAAGYGPNESGQGFGWMGCAAILWRSPVLVFLLLVAPVSGNCLPTQTLRRTSARRFGRRTSRVIVVAARCVITTMASQGNGTGRNNSDRTFQSSTTNISA